MNTRTWMLALALVFAPMGTGHASPRKFCALLRQFVEAVRPDEKRRVVFRTSWGSNFKNDPTPALFAKQCDHDGFAPAQKVCDYLMQYGLVEFADHNVKDALACLSRQTKLSPSLELGHGAFSFSYGTGRRGALIDISLEEDNVVGGMAFRLEADGYGR